MVSNVHTRTAKRLEKTLKVLAYSQIKYSFIAQDCHSAFKKSLKINIYQNENPNFVS